MHLNAVNSAINQMMSFGAGGGGSAPFSPSVPWPDGADSPGMWIDPAYTAASFQDSAGTTALSAIGTVADSANPVGLILDRKAGATVLADPGLHMLQATSPARPLASARVNLLTYTEDFNSFNWRNLTDGMTVTTEQVDPNGGTAAVLLKPTAALNWHGFDKLNYFSGIGDNVFRLCIKPSGLQYFFMLTGAAQLHEMGVLAACFDLTGAGSVVRVGAWNASAEIELHSSGYYICTITSIVTAGGMAFGASNSSTWGEFTGDGTSGFYYAFPDLRRAQETIFPPYQSVPGNGSAYAATGFPVYQQYDGTDEGQATVTVTADTVLTAGMDALIAIRRDSTANAVCGLYESVAEANKVFGIAESASGSGCVGSGAGTPTVWVDGVQLTGGTAVTRATLHTALTPGPWHILEFRNLDLSTWTAAGFGLYTSYVFNGGRGPIMLFESGQDASRDLARAQMAAYFGVTLP